MHKYIFQLSKAFLFQAIQFSISSQFTSIWPINRTLSGATTTGQSGPGSDGYEGVLRILQSSSITGAVPSYCLVLYQDYSHLLYEKTYLKSRDEMNDFIYKTWFYLQNVVCWSIREKNPKRKNSPFGCPPIPTSTI